MARPSSLDVYLNDDLVGSIHDTSPLSFAYSPAWLNRRPLMAIAAIAPVREPQASELVQAFFENLLPEGDLRAYITQQKKASTLFALLAETAGDTAGGFVILPAGKKPEPPAYRPSTWVLLGDALRKRSVSAIDMHEQGTRISLAGAQDKTSVAIFANGIPMLPKGTSPSTHILKPDIRRFAKVWDSAANEAIIMRTAAHCGLPTAEVFYEPHTRACLVKRFDRFIRENGSLGRLVQYDFCQLSGTVSDRKYEKEGGPGIADCARLLRTYSGQAATDLRNLVSWIFFNLYTGNNDSHAKNLSMYYTPEAGVRLTPFYDLMCTRLYPGLSREFAFAIGGEAMPGQIRQAHVVAMARELDMQAAFVLRMARDMADRLPAALARAIEEIQPSLAPGAATLATRLQHRVLSMTRQLATRIKG
jgi:serine/threonine-protein kinase HipA